MYCQLFLTARESRPRGERKGDDIEGTWRKKRDREERWKDPATYSAKRKGDDTSIREPKDK